MKKNKQKKIEPPPEPKKERPSKTSRHLEKQVQTSTKRKKVLEDNNPKRLKASESMERPSKTSRHLEKQVQEALVTYQACTKDYQKTIANYNNVSVKLGIVFKNIKKHYPSVLKSVESDEYVQVTRNIMDQEDNKKTREAYVKDCTIFKNMMRIFEEFNNSATVLKAEVESTVVKQRILDKLNTQVQLYEQMLDNVKKERSWMAKQNQLVALETPDQLYRKKVYQNYFQILHMKLMEMKTTLNKFTHASQSESSAPCTITSSQEISAASSSKTPSAVPDESLFPSTMRWPDMTDLLDDFMHQPLPDKPENAISDYNFKDFSVDLLPPSVTNQGGAIGIQNNGIDEGTSTIQTDGNNDDAIEAIISELNLIVDQKDLDQKEVGDSTNPPISTVYCPTNKKPLFNIVLQSEISCTECQKQYTTKESLYRHKLLNHATRVCNLCTEMFTNSVTLTQHVSRSHQTYRLCEVCFESVDISRVLEHAVRKHPGSADEKTQCRVCSKSFLIPQKLKQHELTHKKSMYPCNICGDSFLSMYEQRSHFNGHLVLTRNICKICLMNFLDRESLWKHLKTDHNACANQRPTEYDCMFCDFQCVTEVDLVGHILSHHRSHRWVQGAYKGQDNGSPKYKCSRCCKFFKGSDVCAVHEILIHQKPPFKCSCKAAFFTKAMLDSHFIKHTRTEEESFKEEQRLKNAQSNVFKKSDRKKLNEKIIDEKKE